MELFPSIDIRNGRCVRLVQGDFAREIAYEGDPVDVARGYERAGAEWIHVVDLDAARTGEPVNREVVADVATAVGVRVQAGGGVTDDALLRAGVARVVVGTAAFRDPEWFSGFAGKHPGRVAVALDNRQGAVATRGWRDDAGMTIEQAMSTFERSGAAAFVVTEIGRDGMLSGPDLAALGRVLAGTSLDVVASGGVGSLDDLRALGRLEREGRRLAGVIVGRALYDGLFSVEEAIAACAPSG